MFERIENPAGACRRRGAASLRGLLLCALLAGAGSAGAQTVYRWVDDKGVTHYGSAPPPGVQAAPMRGAPAPQSADAASQARAERQRVLDQADRLAAERLRQQGQQQAKDEAAQRRAQAQLQRCASARAELDILSQGGPVFGRNAQGERVAVEEGQRERVVARLRGEVAEACVPGDAAQDAATRQRLDGAEQRTRCNLARDQVRELEGAGSRVSASDLARVREQVNQLCGSAR
jgi:Domain of unknown function (DUF4124)